MKKSKFLKKSLSLLLAVLLVVAMVPMGAAAADAPTLIELRVGAAGTTDNQLATISQSSKRVEVIVPPSVPFDALSISYVSKNGKGDLYLKTSGGGMEFINPAGGGKVDATAYDQGNGVAILPLRIQDPVDANSYTDYTLYVQNTKLDDNVRIKEFSIPGMISTTFAPGKTQFEVVMPYNFNLDGGMAGYEINPTIVLEAGTKATHNWFANALNTDDYSNTAAAWDLYGTAHLEVTSEDGQVEWYFVDFRRAEAITSFDFEEACSTEITYPHTWHAAPGAAGLLGNPNFHADSNYVDGGTITINVPQHSKADTFLSDVVADFTSELNPSKVELLDLTIPATPTVTELKSGVTSVNLNAGIGVANSYYIVVTYPASDANGAVAVYELILNEEPNPDLTYAKVKDFDIGSPTIANFNVYGTIEGDEMKVSIANTMDPSNLVLNMTVPADTTVTIGHDSQTEVAATALNKVFGTVQFNPIDLRKPVAVKVETPNGYAKTYMLTVTVDNSAPQEPKFTGFYLKNNVTGDVIEADPAGLKGVEINLKIPAGTRVSDLTGYTIYYSAPIGAQLQYKTNTTAYNALPKSGTVLGAADFNGGTLFAAPWSVFPIPHKEDSLDRTEIKVTTYPQHSSAAAKETKYVVKFVHEDFKTGSKIGTDQFKLTSARSLVDLCPENTYTAIAKSEYHAGKGQKVGTLAVQMWADYHQNTYVTPIPLNNLFVENIDLPDGASIYVEDPGTPNAIKYYGIHDAAWTNTPVIDGSLYTDVNNALKVYVVSEKGVYDVDRAKIGTAQMVTTPGVQGLEDPSFAGVISTYYMYVEAATPRAAVGLTDLSIVGPNGKEVAATVAGDRVTLNVPYSWANASKTDVATDTIDSDGVNMHLKYTAKPGNWLQSTSVAGNITFFNGGWLTADHSDYETRANGDAYIHVNPEGKVFTIGWDGVNSVFEGSSWTMWSETGTKKPYQVLVKVLPVNTEAVLKSFSINGYDGKIEGDTVTLVLPYKTDYSDVAAKFEASEMATVTYDATMAEVVSEVTKLDYRKEVSLTVRSEDKLSFNTYKIKVSAPLQFSDVNPGDWFYDAVMEAAELGIVTGNGDGTFKPHNPVTRADFVLMLTRAYGVTAAELDTYTNNPFMDVKIDDYYGKAVAWAADKGFVTGYTAADFRPGNNISREEMATIFCRVQGLSQDPNPTDAEKYTDHGNISDWAIGYVYGAKNGGIMKGHKNGSFTPTETATRAETAQAMINYYKLK